MESESGVARSIIEELHSLELQGDQMEGERVLREVSLMNFILVISKEIIWKMKVVLLLVLLMNFILRISNEIEWKLQVV